MNKTQKCHIGEGSSCFLIKDSSFKLIGDDSFDNQSVGVQFIEWLESQGYVSWNVHGWWSYVDWVFVNIQSKVYAPGMPGIKITDTVGNHCITIDEFKTIYQIFKKYEGKSILEF